MILERIDMFKVGDTVKVVDSSYSNRVGDVGRVCELEDGIAYLGFVTKSGYWILDWSRLS